MKKLKISATSIYVITVLFLTGCSGPIQNDGHGDPLVAVPPTDIPTSGVLNCPPNMKADMNYRPGDIINPRIHKQISQFGCKAAIEYKTRYLNGIFVDNTQEEITRRCRTERGFVYKKDFWMKSQNPDYKVYSASFLADKFRGSVLQTNASGSRNVQCYATVEALFKKV